MKTFYKFTVIMISLFMLVLPVNGQTFIPATTNDLTAASNITNVVNTGTSTIFYDNDNLNVTVWDGASPGISWSSSNSLFGNLQFNGYGLGQIEDPDVVIRDISGVVYAFVIYITGNVYFKTNSDENDIIQTKLNINGNERISLASYSVINKVIIRKIVIK